jgi:hypothetical protein
MRAPDIQPTRMVNRGIRRVLPHSLLGRSLLMILLPLVLLLAVSLQIFYGSHLDIVSRRLSGAIAGEIAYTLEMLRRFPDRADRAWILRRANSEFETSPALCARRSACHSPPTGCPTAITC